MPSLNTTPSRRAVLQQLADWRAAGLTHLPHAAPRTPPADTARAVNAAASVATPAVPVPSEEAPRLFDSPPAIASSGASSLSRVERQQRLCALAAKVAECTRCSELAKARTQTVFGVGNPEARVMFIGEAPGADEDAQGEPFVGKAGQLLNKIIAACGWQREQVYICNILRCRPPGNRTPLPKEAENCREWLDGQIAIVDPEYIVCWGSCAAQNLLGMTDSIGKMRGRWYQYGRAKVLCTYHPSYLLRNQEAKKPVWDDMQFLLKEMGLEPPPRS
jgi:DNA polymerase